MNIYALKDVVANKFITTTLCESDDMFVRQSLYAILMDYPLKDVEFYCVGQFDNDLGIIKPCRPRLCSWESYKFPTSRADKEHFLTLEEIEKSAKEKKHEFLQRTKDKIADVERAICVANGELKKEEEKKTKDKKRIKELKEYIKVQSQDLKRLKEVN